MLNPVFSIAHMREMSEVVPYLQACISSPFAVPIFYEVTHKVCLLHSNGRCHVLHALRWLILFNPNHQMVLKK
jgi:hypothetical protein